MMGSDEVPRQYSQSKWKKAYILHKGFRIKRLFPVLVYITSR